LQHNFKVILLPENISDTIIKIAWNFNKWQEKNMIQKNKLSKQVAACIVVMLLIIFSFWVFTKDNEQRIMEQNMEYIQDSTMQISRQIDHVFSHGYENIRILSAFLSQSLDQPEVDIELVREIAQDSVFDFIEFADMEGMDHNVTGGVSDARDRQYYLDGIKGNTGMEVIFDSRATHETLLMFYSPVTFEGEIVGVLIGVYQADNKLAKLLTTTYFGEQANLYLCMPNGRVVASNLPLDTRENINITDLAQGDDALADNISKAMQSGENLNFTLENQKSGGCMTKLEKEGWYLIQLFPEAANVTMVHEANRAGIMLEVMLLIIFFAILALLVHFHRKERRNIAKVAEERGEYKNAVLADAVLVFEANLTKNQVWEGIWKDKNGNRISVEEFMGIHLPYNYDRFVVQSANSYVDENSKELFLKNTDRKYLIRQFEQGRSEIMFEYSTKLPTGEKLFVRRSAYLTADKRSGDIIAYNNVKDITEQKQREERQRALIEDALFQAESASRAKTKFLSNMSHDIRTPMNAIIGFTTLAMKHIDNKEQVQDYLEKIAVSGDHLLSLINDVLDMSRIESGRIHLEETECNLWDLMHELKKMLAMEMQSRNLEFNIDMEDVVDGQIICDRLRLNQIFLNLLGNAMKFTAPGGSISVKVTEKPEKDGDKAIYEFRVKDTGIGMSEEFQKHIFEPFERERSSTVSGVQGTGLGMAITKNFVEMMNGTISVVSKKDVGTEFILHLPVKKASVTQAETVSKEEEKNIQTVRMSMEGKRILLVEDNDLNREIARKILGESGLLVEEAEDGSIALDKLLEMGPGYYSLVLMDIQMPIMDGYTATQEIRRFENKELANIPIIAMTANAFEEDKRKALEAGMDAHIAKPIEVNRLLDELERILGRAAG